MTWEKPSGRFIPTEQFGLKGLETFDDPQFIDDQAMPWCMNMILDGNELAPRKGTFLLYPKQDGETSAPQQLFTFTDGQGNQFLLAKYAMNWYVWDEVNSAWVIIASQDPASSFYGNSIWTSEYYSNDVYTAGTGNNFAFFAPSSVAGPILMFPLGMTYLSGPASIGDTVIAVQNANKLSFVNGGYTAISVGGVQYLGAPGSSFTLDGTLSNGSDIISGLPSTGSIIVGATVSGVGIPSLTTVTNIISSTEIEISNDATSTPTSTFVGTATITSGSDTATGFLSEVAATGDVVSGSKTVSNVSIVSGQIPVAGMTITDSAGNLPGLGDFVVSVTPSGSNYTILMSEAATGSLVGGNIYFWNVLADGMLVSGNGIPDGTLITGLVGSNPGYTGFTMNNSATTSVTGSFVFSSVAQTTLTFSEQNIVILQSPITANVSEGTAVTATLTYAPITYWLGTSVLIWLAHLVVATNEGIFAFSISGNPFQFTGVTSGVINGINGKITDMRTFGQFFIASAENALNVAQEIVAADTSTYGIFFTPYLSGQGMGVVSAAGSILYNNQYYYPTSVNGIIVLTPNFTGTSSSAGVEVLTDKIHNLVLQFTFERALPYNRKLYWIVSTIGTPEQPSQTYYLVYDQIRSAFTLCQHPSVDLINYQNQLCLFGTDGNIYQGEYDSYEDNIGGKSVGYLAEAYSKRYDLGDPADTKETHLCMVQGKILSGTTLYCDVLYNEGGSLGKQTYAIVGDTSKPYFTLPGFNADAMNPLALQTLGGGNLSVGTYRVYLELNKSLKYHNYQLHFYTEKAGSYWTVGIVSPKVELSTTPEELIISPK